MGKLIFSDSIHVEDVIANQWEPHGVVLTYKMHSVSVFKVTVGYLGARYIICHHGVGDRIDTLLPHPTTEAEAIRHAITLLDDTASKDGLAHADAHLHPAYKE